MSVWKIGNGAKQGFLLTTEKRKGTIRGYGEIKSHGTGEDAEKYALDGQTDTEEEMKMY